METPFESNTIEFDLWAAGMPKEKCKEVGLKVRELLLISNVDYYDLLRTITFEDRKDIIIPIGALYGSTEECSHCKGKGTIEYKEYNWPTRTVTCFKCKGKTK